MHLIKINLKQFIIFFFTKLNVVLKIPSAAYLCLILLIWSFIFFPTYYDFPFMWDDLHLVRPYSNNELQSVLFGHWDPDKVETPAYRPFATFIYHLQAYFFGENVIYHRLFNLFLLFSVLLIIIAIATQLRISKIQIWVTLTFIVFSKIFITLAVWITTSQIITSYLMISLSAFFFIRSAHLRYGLNAALSILFYIIALFTREESYMLPFLMVLLVFASDIFTIKKKYYLLVLLMLLFLFAHFFARQLIINDYLNKPFTFSSGGVIYFLTSIWLPGGSQAHGFLDNLLKYLCLLMLAILFCQSTRNLDFKKIFLFFMAVIFASLPALHTPRPFGTMLPSVIAFFFISFLIFSRFSWNYHISNIFRILFILIFLIAGINRSFYVVNTFNPNSEDIISFDSKFIYGQYGSVSIPEQRRIAKKAHLLSLGIYSNFSIDSIRSTKDSSIQDLRMKIIFPKYKHFEY